MAKSKKSGAKKAGAKKASKKAAAKTKPQTAAAAALADESCLSLTKSAFIVGGCLPAGPHGPEDTLEETGLFTPGLRDIFQQCVFNGVNRAGCDIDRSEIPNEADTTVAEVVQAVSENAR